MRKIILFSSLGLNILILTAIACFLFQGYSFQNNSLTSSTSIVDGKFYMFLVGDERTAESKKEMALFDEAVKDMGIQYKWVGPAEPLATDVSDCKYQVNYICNFNKEHKSVHVVLGFSENDGTDVFEVSYSKDTDNPITDSKKLIADLMKLGLENASIIQRLR
jgi:hypothetical protein